LRRRKKKVKQSKKTKMPMTQEMRLKVFNMLRRMTNEKLLEMYNKLPDPLPTNRKMMIQRLLDESVVTVHEHDEDLESLIKKHKIFARVISGMSKLGNGVNMPGLTTVITAMLDLPEGQCYTFKAPASENLGNFLRWVKEQYESDKSSDEFCDEGIQKIRDMGHVIPTEIFQAVLGEIFDTAVISLRNRGEENPVLRNTEMNFNMAVMAISEYHLEEINDEMMNSIEAIPPASGIRHHVSDMTQEDMVSEDDPINDSDDVVSDNPVEALIKNINEDKSDSVIICQGEAFENGFKSVIRTAINNSGRFKLLNVSKLDKKLWGTFRRHNKIKGHVEVYECMEPDNKVNRALKKRWDPIHFRGPIIIM
jgi:hypothetical protein